MLSDVFEFTISIPIGKDKSVQYQYKNAPSSLVCFSCHLSDVVEKDVMRTSYGLIPMSIQHNKYLRSFHKVKKASFTYNNVLRQISWDINTSTIIQGWQTSPFELMFLLLVKVVEKKPERALYIWHLFTRSKLKDPPVCDVVCVYDAPVPAISFLNQISFQKLENNSTIGFHKPDVLIIENNDLVARFVDA